MKTCLHFCLIVLLIFIPFTAAQTPEGKTFVIDEKLIGENENCGIGYVEEAAFIDAAENEVKFCVKRAAYNTAPEYIVFAAFQDISGEILNCERGEEKGLFTSSVGGAALCVQTSEYKGGRILEEVKLSGIACDTDYISSEINLGSKKIIHCAKYFGEEEFCGNNLREGNELCDGDDLIYKNCDSLGFLEGELKCNEQCQIDHSECTQKKINYKQYQISKTENCNTFTTEESCEQADCQTIFKTEYERSTVGCGGVKEKKFFESCTEKEQCLFENTPEETVLTYTNPEASIINLAIANSPVSIDFDKPDSTFNVIVPSSSPELYSRIENGGYISPERTQFGTCSLYTFDYEINLAGSYEAPFVREKTDSLSSPTRTCFYQAVFGSPVPGFVDCPEVQDSLNTVDADSSCAQTLTCTYNFQKTYIGAFLVVEDSANCNPLVLPLNTKNSQDKNEITKEAKKVCEEIAKETAKCGNSKLEEGEECDDGNTLSGDGCSSECKFENPLCNGIIPPATTRAPISAQANIKIEAEIDSHALLTQRYYNFEGKVTSITRVEETVDNQLPAIIISRIIQEGNVAVIEGIYAESMFKIQKENPTLWRILKNIEGEGILSLGIVYELDSDGLTIKNLYSTNTAMHDFILQNKDAFQKNYFYIDNIIELDSQGPQNTLVVSQIITVKDEVKSTKKKTIHITETDARALKIELMKNIELFNNAQKKSDNGQWSAWAPVIDGDEVYEKAKKSQLKEGLTLEQKNGNYELRKKITHEHSLTNLLKYVDECVKKLNGGSLTSAAYEDEFYPAISGTFV